MENHLDILNRFFEGEVCEYISEPIRNILININIGTKESLDQEINVEWFTSIRDHFFDSSYKKIIYYFDSEYRDVSFKNNYLEKLIDKLKSVIDISNDFNFNFDFSRPYQYIEKCIDSNINLIICKVGYNLESSYEAHTLHRIILRDKISYEVCLDSIPNFDFWNSFHNLLTIFSQNFDYSIICINNYACTNSRFFINEKSGNPICINAYVGEYFEYLSELIYILNSISDCVYNKSKILVRVNKNTNYNKLLNFNKLF